MANKPKIGLDYFPLDVDFFSDIKIRKLIKLHSSKSVAVYIYLVCTIYKNGYYLKWDDDLFFIISESLNYEEDYIKSVFESCLNIRLFDRNMFDKHKVITSKGIQERYEFIGKISKRKSIITEYIVNNTEELPNNTEELPQRKVKKSKEKESKENEIVIPSLNEFLEYVELQIKEDFKNKKYSVEMKYKSWIENDWKDGNNNKIKNWKSKILNTIPYLTNTTQNGTTKQHSTGIVFDKP